MGEPRSGLGEHVHAMLHPHAARHNRHEQEEAARKAAAEAAWVEATRSTLGPWRYKMALVPHSQEDMAQSGEAAAAIRAKLFGPHTIVMGGIYHALRRESVEPQMSQHRAALARELSSLTLGMAQVARGSVLYEEPDEVSLRSFVTTAADLSGLSDPSTRGESFGIVLVERQSLKALGIDGKTGPLLFGGPTYVPNKLSWIPLT